MSAPSSIESSTTTVIPSVDPTAEAIRELEGFYRRLAELGSDPSTTFGELRSHFERWGDAGGEPLDVDYQHVDAGGTPALWAVPQGAAAGRAIVCSHGGGYAFGSVYSHRKLYGHLAKAVGCRALLVDYRRAPDTPHPGPVNDVLAAYRWLLDDQRYGPQHIAFAGDSAGGALCFSVVTLARQLGVPTPAALMPISPWIDLEALDPVYTTNDRDLVGTREGSLAAAAMFLGEDGDRRDPLAAPIHADLHGFPPIYMQAGGCENIAADARTMARRAEAAGVEVKLDVVEDMQHCFPLLAGAAPEADAALRRYAEWVRPRLGLS